MAEVPFEVCYLGQGPKLLLEHVNISKVQKGIKSRINSIVLLIGHNFGHIEDKRLCF